MSKRKIDETMTAARIARKKRAQKTQGKEHLVETPVKELKSEVPAEVAIETDPEPTSKPRKGRLAIVRDEKSESEPPQPKSKRKAKGKVRKEKAPKEDLVVFAFRLKVHERDLIHKAAGAAKASRFVRALTVAASMGDEKTVTDIVRAVKSEIVATT